MSTTATNANELRLLDTAEINAVCGGLLPAVDVTGMPDRSEMCGTMWLLDRMRRLFRR